MRGQYDKNNPTRVSAHLLVGSAQAAEDLNLPLAGLLKKYGIGRQQIESGEGKLPLHCVVGFLNDCATESGCDHFGLKVAKYQPPGKFAMMGQLIRFADTLGNAIEDAVTFSLLNSEYSEWHVKTYGNIVELIRSTRVSFDAPLAQIKMLALAVVYKTMNAVLQQRVRLQQVNLAMAPPTQQELLEQFFAAPVLFDQPRSSLVFDAETMQTPVPTADPDVHRLLREHLLHLEKALSPGATLIERLRKHITETLGSRYCSLEATCEAWGIHPRSLQRALRVQNTSFRSELLHIRMNLAKDYLRNTTVSVGELADVLGYQNASAFSRAFKQQLGVAPEHWRQH